MVHLLMTDCEARKAADDLMEIRATLIFLRSRMTAEKQNHTLLYDEILRRLETKADRLQNTLTNARMGEENAHKK